MDQGHCSAVTVSPLPLSSCYGAAEETPTAEQSRASPDTAVCVCSSSGLFFTEKQGAVNTPLSSHGNLSVLLKDVWSSPGDTEPIQQIFEHIASARG